MPLASSNLNNIKRMYYLGEDTNIETEVYKNPAGGSKFKVNFINLDKFNFPKDAKINVFAHQGVIIEKYNFGTVGKPLRINKFNIAKSISPDRLNIRIKVLDKSKILARADGIKPYYETDDEKQVPESSRGIFPVKNDIDISCPVKVDMDGESDVVLLTREELDIKARLDRNNLNYKFLIFPLAAREVFLRFILKDPRLENEADKFEKWKKMGERELSKPFPDIQEEQLNWLDEVIDALCMSRNFLKDFKTLAQEEVEDN